MEKVDCVLFSIFLVSLRHKVYLSRRFNHQSTGKECHVVPWVEPMPKCGECKYGQRTMIRNSVIYNSKRKLEKFRNFSTDLTGRSAHDKTGGKPFEPSFTSKKKSLTSAYDTQSIILRLFFVSLSAFVTFFYSKYCLQSRQVKRTPQDSIDELII